MRCGRKNEKKSLFQSLNQKFVLTPPPRTSLELFKSQRNRPEVTRGLLAGGTKFCDEIFTKIPCFWGVCPYNGDIRLKFGYKIWSHQPEVHE